MVIIAIGTLVGTYCIQQGNLLKSKEGSEKQLSEMNNLKSILNQQNATLSAQSTTLDAQKILLNEQLMIIKGKELENFFANRQEYDLLVRKFATVGRCMFSGNYSKDLFFKLTHEEVLSVSNDVSEAITEIKACHFSSLSHYLAQDCWGMLSLDLSGLLYNLSFREGDKIKSTTNGITTMINVDKKYLDEKYEMLQNTLKEYGNKRHEETQRMTNEAYKKYGKN
jgi:hypothetical protein